MFKIISLIGCLIFGGCHSSQKSSPISKGKPVFFGDPFVLLHQGTYYMYGTSEADTGIKVYQSDDLKHWKGPVGLHNGFALYKDDVYGNHGFWAPEVYLIDGTYYMFFSTQEHMAIATSNNPTGPFKQKNKSVLRDHKGIDHDLFIDDDGTKYIYFANFKKGLEIWGAKLKDDFSGIKEETLTRLLHQSQAWEKSPKKPVAIVDEGPFVMKKDGTYYMTYSANHYASVDYGIGLAKAHSPLGKWTKSKQNPLIQHPDSLVGTGHNSFFTDKKGQRYIVYHAHFDSSRVHPRIVFMNPVRFEKSGDTEDTIDILSPRIEPRIISSVKDSTGSNP